MKVQMCNETPFLVRVGGQVFEMGACVHRRFSFDLVNAPAMITPIARLWIAAEVFASRRLSSDSEEVQALLMDIRDSLPDAATFKELASAALSWMHEQTPYTEWDHQKLAIKEPRSRRKNV
jgi:hypothetical protein